jgi:hypothetical protein
MKITLTYFDGVEAKVVEIENTKQPIAVNGGLFLQFLDGSTVQTKELFLTSRIVRIEIEYPKVQGVILH